MAGAEQLLPDAPAGVPTFCRKGESERCGRTKVADPLCGFGQKPFRPRGGEGSGRVAAGILIRNVNLELRIRDQNIHHASANFDISTTVPQSIYTARCSRPGPILFRSRDHRPLCVAFVEISAWEHAWLRHHRPNSARS